MLLEVQKYRSQKSESGLRTLWSWRAFLQTQRPSNNTGLFRVAATVAIPAGIAASLCGDTGYILETHLRPVMAGQSPFHIIYDLSMFQHVSIGTVQQDTSWSGV